MTKIIEKSEITNKILAQTLNELNPARTVEEWEDHIKKTGNNPKAFFGDNGEGLAEYDSFVRTYDKETYKRTLEKNGLGGYEPPPESKQDIVNVKKTTVRRKAIKI